MGLLAKIRHSISKFVLKTLYYGLFNLHLIYACQIWGQKGLTSWGEGASLTLVGYPFSDDITIKICYGVCFVALTSLTPHLFLSGWLKLNLILLLDQLKLP